MLFKSINPANNHFVQDYETMASSNLETLLNQNNQRFQSWRKTSITHRVELVSQLANILRKNNTKYAELICLEMGKLIHEAELEVEKCAGLCDYYAEHAETFLKNEFPDPSNQSNYIQFQPLGTVLGIMPWNFPFWQVFRFAVPTLLAGNIILLKHAPNVCGCSLIIEELFLDADFPEGVFKSLILTNEQASFVIKHSSIAAVSLTGSFLAGKTVAAQAGSCVKPSLLELGGSDPFLILNDASLEQAVTAAIKSRFMNAGQSCIAAKRFIVEETVADDFVGLFKIETEKLKTGDPFDSETTLAPIAREDLRETLAKQVNLSIKEGAKVITGGSIPKSLDGFYYEASILDAVTPGMPAFDEELFGPVAAIIRVKDVSTSIKLANQSNFGLGASIWTNDIELGTTIANKIEAGIVCINQIVQSTYHMPFGGIKQSGYGRELGKAGILAFTNQKSVYVNSS